MTLSVHTQTPTCTSGCMHAQSCLTLCGPMDCSPPDSSSHGIVQAKGGLPPLNFVYGPLQQIVDCLLNSPLAPLHFPDSLAIRLGHVTCSSQCKWGIVYFSLTKRLCVSSNPPSSTLAILEITMSRGLQGRGRHPNPLRLQYDQERRLYCIMLLRL